MSAAKRLLSTIAFWLIAASIAAQQPGVNPVATSDRMFAPTTNPAAIAVGNSQGFGLSASVSPDVTAIEEFDVYLNGRYSAYVFSKAATLTRHLVAFGLPASPDLAFGSSWRWESGKFNLGEAALALLYRPARFVSMGLHGTLPLHGVGEYRVGVGLRPLWFLGDGAVTLTADTTLTHTVDDGSLVPESTFIGIAVEPVPGVRFTGAYGPADGGFWFGVTTKARRATLDISAQLDEDLVPTGFELAAHASVRANNTTIDWRESRLVEYDRPTTLVEVQPVPTLDLFGADVQTISVHDVVDWIDTLSEDPLVEGIVFDRKPLTGSFAAFLEMEKALHRLREAGKEVVFYFENVSTLNYALAASTATSLYLHPLGTVYLTGLYSGRLYLQDFLDRFGVSVVDLAGHPYKTAYDNLSEPNMTDAEREALTSLQADRYETLVEMISAGRSDKLSQDAGALVEKGPYLIAEKAHETGLVDELILPQELTEALENRSPTAHTSITPMTIAWDTPEAAEIGVIFATGPIHTGESFEGQSIGAESLVQAIRSAREDPSIDAILLRVNSSGGSALASDSIAEEIRRTTRGDSPKPLVVSMGGVAASGGYYISAYADRIVASPVTITGSIGVTSFTFSVSEGLEKLGISFDSVKTTENSTFGLPFEPLDSQAIETQREAIDYIYQAFTSHVSQARGLDPQEVEAAAQGRVYTGRQARELGLVDSLGTFDDAVETLKKTAGIDGPIKLRRIPWGRSPLRLNNVFDRASAQAWRRLTEYVPEAESLRWLRHFREGEPLYLMPFSFREDRS